MPLVPAPLHPIFNMKKTQTNATKVLHEMKDELMNRTRIEIRFAKAWFLEIDPKAGVYVLFDKSSGKKDPVYVGETGNLRKRLKDFNLDFCRGPTQ